MLDDEKLIQACKNGDKAGQYQLVKKYSGILMSICRRYAPDEPTAKDMLQESWIRVFRYIDSYKTKGSFVAWLKTITVNASLNWLKKTKKRNEVSASDMSDYEKSTRPLVLDQYDAEVIINLIQKLPEGYRAVFNLVHLEGYNHREVAQKLNISESASRSQYSRARKILKNKILSFANKANLI